MFRKPGLVYLIVTLMVLLISGGSIVLAADKNLNEPVVIAPPEVHWAVSSKQWEVPFQVMNADGNQWKVRLLSFEINQKPVKLDRLKFEGITNLEVPVVNAGKWVTKDELKMLRDSIQEARKGREIDQDKAKLVSKVSKSLVKMHREQKIQSVFIDFKDAVSELELKAGEQYTVKGTFEAVSKSGANTTLTLETDAAILSFPAGNGWFHGDLHSHSTFSDGSKTIPELKEKFTGMYDFMYLTDHSDFLQGNFDKYSIECASNWNSDSEMSFFPGVEVSSVDDNGEATGDALAYGVIDMTGLENMTNSCQEVIDNINNNDTGRSTSSIAHPYGIPSWSYWPAWSDWNVVRYYGYELMSGWSQGLLYGYSFNSIPIARWRSELASCINDTFGFGYRPSARTGMDYEIDYFYVPYHTWVSLPSNWKTFDYNIRKEKMDLSLKEGKTSVSKRGSLAVFTVNDKPVGSLLKNVPAGTKLHFNVGFCPTMSGPYKIKIYKGQGTEVKSKTYFWLNAGRPVSFVCDLPSGSGRQFYWIYVEGLNDWAYTSPIYISSSD